MSRAGRAASLLLLLVGLICASPAAARDLSFQPLAGPAAGTCDLGAPDAYRLAVAAGSAAQAALAPCLGTTTAGRVLLVAAPDEPRAGTTPRDRARRASSARRGRARCGSSCGCTAAESRRAGHRGADDAPRRHPPRGWSAAARLVDRGRGRHGARPRPRVTARHAARRLTPRPLEPLARDADIAYVRALESLMAPAGAGVHLDRQRRASGLVLFCAAFVLATLVCVFVGEALQPPLGPERRRRAVRRRPRAHLPLRPARARLVRDRGARPGDHRPLHADDGARQRRAAAPAAGLRRLGRDVPAAGRSSGWRSPACRSRRSCRT